MPRILWRPEAIQVILFLIFICLALAVLYQLLDATHSWGLAVLVHLIPRPLMLALHRPRCLLHSTRYLQLRYLRTLPRETPTYIKQWDPTLHRPARSRPPSTETNHIAESTCYNAVDTAKREELNNVHHDVAVYQDGQTGHKRAYRRLDRVLQLVSCAYGRDPKLRAPLWRAYMRARLSNPKLLRHLPDRAWDLLWTTQSAESSDNRLRREHLEQLHRDMVMVGQVTTVGQRVKYLESIFLGGKEEQALREWEEDSASGVQGARQSHKPEYLEVGAKLHALAGNVDRSRIIMEELFRLYPSWDTSIMMAVLRAHTSSKLREHHDLAMQIYVTMKRRKVDGLSIEDCDASFVGFLEARHLGHAKQVFRDMIRNGRLATEDTTEAVEQVLTRLHTLYRLGTDISKMTSIALDAISVLPGHYHSHLFGNWMKSAVVHKAPEAAAQILDVMYKRGYTPETIHFNMLLRALIRTKEGPNILKAENIGWRMIGEASKANRRTTNVSNNQFVDTQNYDEHIRRSVPVANVSTFALIIQHHAKNLQWEHVDYLSRQLKTTTIAPNATIMNVLMDNKCRQGAYSEVWTIYKTLTEPSEGTGVFPNGATFRCLWKALRLALGDHATRNDPNLPTPRDLLKEMISWWTLIRSRYDSQRFLQGLAAADRNAIIALIMHCFSYTQDLAGSLVALHVLRHNFNIFPTDKAALILQRQLAWVDMARESDTVRSQYFHSRSNKKNTERIVRVYDILLQRRLERMDVKEEEYARFTNEQIGDVGLNLLSEFVRVVLKRTYPPEIVEAMIDAARCSVGMPDLPTGDMDAFEVA